MKRTTLMMSLVGIALLASPAWAANHEVLQKGKQFVPKTLTIKAGDTVSFRNEDDFSHNVFSLSDNTTFDLGSYPKGQAKTVKFEKPGTVTVECAIHPAMKMTIKVEK